MLDYGEICANCIVAANKVMDDWCELSERSANFGEPISNPYDNIPLDDLDGVVIGVNEMCKELITQKELTADVLFDCIEMFIITDKMICVFNDIIGESICYECMRQQKDTFWKVEPVAGKYSFTLLEMWWVVNEYAHWLEKYNSREQIEIAVKSWYSYHQNGGKTNLLHWLMGARENKN